MKNKIVTLSIREIKKSFSRFFSLFIMSLLGTLVFVGIKSSGPDMIDSLDKYYDSHNVYDLKLESLSGFSDEWAKKLSTLEGIDNVEESYTIHSNIATLDKEFVASVHSITKKINQITLVEGSFPEKDNEVLVEKNMLDVTGLTVGSSFTLENDIFKEKEVVITGIVDSPLYINAVSIDRTNRGTTTLGAGNINFYIYMNDTNILLPRYTEINLTVTNAKNFYTSSAEYNELIDETVNNLEGFIKSEFEDSNYLLSKRMDYSTYKSYIDDTESVSNLSKIFPVVFFIVAVLISLISMSRMVENDRLQIGTLKSLGFNNFSIIFKYILFSFFGAVTGGVIGSLLGLILIPNLIWSIYSLLFDLPKFYTSFNIEYILIGIGVEVICICGATLYTALRDIREKPSALMRPKPPKGSKKILLERIPVIWDNINFSKKVTIRNMLRYKKRALMTVIGILSCTALMLSGFGLRDSIIDLPNKHYKEVFNYDSVLYLNQKVDVETIKGFSHINDVVEVKTFSSKVNDIDINVIVPLDSKDLHKIVNLKDLDETDVELSEDGIIITNKLAKLLGKNIGDNISILAFDNKKYDFKIENIVQNYIGHTIYISPVLYEKVIGKFDYNTLYLKTEELSQENKDYLSKTLLEFDGIARVVYIDTIIENTEDMLNSLNSVVVILIILSASLSFVVLYNLSNININERKREIATLKVLGFYNKEVDNYITKENIILTLIGIFLGLFIGVFLTNIIVDTVELESVQFLREIKLSSFIYSGIITIFFTFIVNFITHFTLKKIDMVGSLKSVE